MLVTPQTEIRLLKLPFTLDNKNQLTFENKQSQENYFLNLPFEYEDNATYQRKDNVIRFPSHIDNIINCNYCIYQNESYSNKWFYAFITNMRYINDNLTEISIITDVFQTWQFDLIYKKMFVEREHVTDDTIGKHTIPEGLETGEYIIDNTIKYNMGKMKYIIQCSEWINYQEGKLKPLATNLGGIYSARWRLFS